MATSHTSCIRIETANPNRDGTGTTEIGWAALSSGGYVERIWINAVTATTQGMIRVYYHDGAAFFLLREIPVQPSNPTAIIPNWEHRIEFVSSHSIGFIMNKASSQTLRFSTERAETFDIVTEGWDL